MEILAGIIGAVATAIGAWLKGKYTKDSKKIDADVTLEQNDSATDSDIRNKLWEQQQKMWERMDAMDERHKEEMFAVNAKYDDLKIKYDEIVYQYNTVILVLKALRAEYDYGHEIDEVLEEFGLKLNGDLIKIHHSQKESSGERN